MQEEVVKKYYCISINHQGKVIIKESQIIKETDRTLFLLNGIIQNRIMKDQLPLAWLGKNESNFKLITEDIEKGKAEWNNKIEEDMNILRDKINYLMSKFI